MITNAILSIIVNTFTILLSWIPQISTLPPIAGYDIDTALVTGMGQFYAFTNYVWPIRDVMLGAGFLWGFHLLLIFLKVILGSRAPSKSFS